MRYWLMKSEPDVFSIDDLKAMPQKTEHWDGVRNYQARNFMREMQIGDRGFFYHSQKEKSIVGIVEVIAEAHPDSTTASPAGGTGAVSSQGAPGGQSVSR